VRRERGDWRSCWGACLTSLGKWKVGASGGLEGADGRKPGGGGGGGGDTE